MRLVAPRCAPDRQQGDEMTASNLAFAHIVTAAVEIASGLALACLSVSLRPAGAL
jgi:hypothetical protein